MIGASDRRARGGWRWSGGVRALLLAPFLLAAAPPAGGQEPARVEVLLAALSEMRGAMPRTRMAVDPTPFCTAQLSGWSCPEPVQRALDALRVEPRGREFTHVCLGGGPRRCQLLGTDALVALGEPTLRNGAASVVVDVWWRTGSRAEPVGHRRVELELERPRRGGEWRVVRTIPRA